MTKKATRADIEAETAAEVATRPRDEIASEVIGGSTFDTGTLRELKSFDEAMQLAASVHGGLINASDEIGDGFALLKDEEKKRLVGIPVMFMEWAFYPGDFGSQFVACRVAVRNPDGGLSKYIINDGSTGIADQLAQLQKDTGRTGGLFTRYGLRESTYTYCAACGTVVNPKTDTAHVKDHKEATTYYIDTRA